MFITSVHMDPLESYRISLRNSLGAALREHHCRRRWHYAIDMDETDQSSLASYLGIKHKKLRSLLLASGLESFHGNQFRLNPKQGNSVYSWEQFLVEQSLTVYFDVFTINCKHHYWIGLGSMEKVTVLRENARGVALPYTPGSQSKYYKTPPRLPAKCNHRLHCYEKADQ